MNAVTPLTDHYLGAFSDLRGQLPGEQHAWLGSIRDAGIAAFAELGFPTPRNEQWKYTNVRQLTKHHFVNAPRGRQGVLGSGLDQAWLPQLVTHRLTFVDGHYAPELSAPQGLPEGVKLVPLSLALQQMPDVLEQHLARYADGSASGFAALNDAFMQDGAVLQLADGVALEKPVHLVFVGTAHSQPTWHNLRNLLVAGANSSASVIETYVGAGESVGLTNAVTEAVLGAGAQLQHYKLQEEGQKGYHVAVLQVHQERDSNFVSHSISAGARLARNDLNVGLEAEGAECSLYGLYIAGGRQHVDYHTRVDHRKPLGTSREFYKGVLGGSARAVFNGQVYVHPHAQRSDAEQSNRNLLLSPDAEVDTKPQLEIYADDVKCSHGATVGQLDENMLYYLRSRGISEQHARAILTYGFARDVVDRIPLAPVRETVERLLMTQLPDAQVLDEGVVGELV
jgi:Fe-S cluster assembly protein SufD